MYPVPVKGTGSGRYRIPVVPLKDDVKAVSRDRGLILEYGRIRAHREILPNHPGERLPFLSLRLLAIANVRRHRLVVDRSSVLSWRTHL